MKVRTMEVEKLMGLMTPDVFKKVTTKMKPVFFGEEQPHYCYDAVTAVTNQYQTEMQKMGYWVTQPKIIAKSNIFEESETTSKKSEPRPEPRTPPSMKSPQTSEMPLRHETADMLDYRPIKSELEEWGLRIFLTRKIFFELGSRRVNPSESC